MKPLELKCYNCGLTKRITYTKAILELIKKGEITFPCNLCCYNNHYRLSIQIFTIIKNRYKENKLRKQHFKNK